MKEERRGDMPLFVHPGWERAFPWLLQGITSREAGNFASFGEQPISAVQSKWRKLRAATGTRCAVLGRQVHGASVVQHDRLADGWLIADDCDGHITSQPGVLLTVSVADCVPVFVVDAEGQRAAVLHAGWRGTAAGILHTCISRLGIQVKLHFGPAICGECYEVGPEVHAALGLTIPAQPTPVDLRRVLGMQAVGLGISPDDITTSAWCTRCGDSPFYSHRAGHAERQLAAIAIR